jgi:hypothetical protein
MPIALVVIGAIVIVAVAARYAPAAAGARSRDAILAECAQLTGQLAAVRQQGGDVGQAAQIQAQLDACVARANALGAGLDASAAKLVQADAAYAQIDAEFRHLRSTDYADWLKRQNTLRTMHRVSADLVRAYDEATTAAESPAAVARVRASILRSLDASIQRRNCYATKAAGCDRSGPAELSAEEKAAAEMELSIRPLADAYRRAAARLSSVGGSSRDWTTGSDVYGDRDFGAVLLLDCERMVSTVRAKFAELQSVDYQDWNRRQNVLSDLLSWETAMVDCIRGALDAARADGSLVGLSAVLRTATGAYSDSYARRTCFATGASGCGRFGYQEATEAEKAAAETRTALDPLGQIIREASASRDAINAARTAAVRTAVVTGSRGRINVGRIG